jgi:hypothetical protein
MRIFVVIPEHARLPGEELAEVGIECSAPYPGASYVVPSKPVCNCGLEASLRMPSFETLHDRFIGKAVCANVECIDVGTMVVVVSTLFGIEEDERVLSGRVGKVY